MQRGINSWWERLALFTWSRRDAWCRVFSTLTLSVPAGASCYFFRKVLIYFDECNPIFSTIVFNSLAEKMWSLLLVFTFCVEFFQFFVFIRCVLTFWSPPHLCVFQHLFHSNLIVQRSSFPFIVKRKILIFAGIPIWKFSRNNT